MENTYYKYCIVSLCTNTTVKTPNKIFIHVPEETNRRSKWLRECGRIGDISSKNRKIFVCEDHFNIEKDMENYIRYKLMGGRKKMKPDIVPHIFDCQVDRKRSLSVSPRAAAVKRAKKKIVASTSATTTQSDSASDNCKEITKKEVNFLRNIYDSSSSEKNSENSSDYSATPSEVSEELSVEIKNQFKNMCYTVMKLQNRPEVYMGIPDYAYYVFPLIQRYCKLDSMHIFLTLKKIRTGNSFIYLADDFGISEDNASKIFSKSLPIISKYVRKFIIKPQSSLVKSNLPLAFQAQYSNVFCIIDCLEIEIEKPSEALIRSLTWSDCNKCHILKYLISCTPNGVINFISGAFGGGASDAVIVENSGFLNTLPFNVNIMAVRGFKHIENLLVVKDCILLRLPTVSAGPQPTTGEVLDTKRIASLPIPVKRVISRLRKFLFLAPHACIGNKLLRYTDNVVKIVCGLTNLKYAVIPRQ